jgi:hypothetical protein
MLRATRIEWPCTLCATALAFLLSSGSSASPPGKQGTAETGKGRLVVHEWGTFLGVQGSDGVTLGGMVDSDEPLPAFVETRSIDTWRRSLLRTKMETPVTYFYTEQPRTVQVKVDMVGGLLTHWYPPVCRFLPSPLVKPSAAALDSSLDWCTVHLIPDHSSGGKPGDGAAQLPVVAADQIWRFARDTNSALVKIDSHSLQGEPQTHYEKFLFYRGLGKFDLPLEVRSSEGAGGAVHLTLRNREDHPLPDLFLVSVSGDSIRFGALPSVAGAAIQECAIDSVLTQPLPLDLGVPEAKNAVAAALEAAGLYAKEAGAMVNTWERSYFHSEGLRLLYLLPAAAVDRIIPLHIKPQPDQLVRVMVGRVELLTPARERQIEKAIGDLAATDFKTREAASTDLARLGRITEPALRRVLARTPDPEVRSRAQALLSRQAAK